MSQTTKPNQNKVKKGEIIDLSPVDKTDNIERLENSKNKNIYKSYKFSNLSKRNYLHIALSSIFLIICSIFAFNAWQNFNKILSDNSNKETLSKISSTNSESSTLKSSSSLPPSTEAELPSSQSSESSLGQSSGSSENTEKSAQSNAIVSSEISEVPITNQPTPAPVPATPSSPKTIDGYTVPDGYIVDCISLEHCGDRKIFKNPNISGMYRYWYPPTITLSEINSYFNPSLKQNYFDYCMERYPNCIIEPPWGKPFLNSISFSRTSSCGDSEHSVVVNVSLNSVTPFVFESYSYSGGSLYPLTIYPTSSNFSFTVQSTNGIDNSFYYSAIPWNGGYASSNGSFSLPPATPCNTISSSDYTISSVNSSPSP